MTEKSRTFYSGFCARQPEVVEINIYAYPDFCSGLTNIAKHWFQIFIFIKSRAAVTGGGNSNAKLAQILNVGCKLYINI